MRGSGLPGGRTGRRSELAQIDVLLCLIENGPGRSALELANACRRAGARAEPTMGGEPIGHLTLAELGQRAEPAYFRPRRHAFRRGQQAQSVRLLPTLIEVYGAGPRTCATEPMPYRQRRRAK
jgi:hypothetical protein